MEHEVDVIDGLNYQLKLYLKFLDVTLKLNVIEAKLNIIIVL